MKKLSVTRQRNGVSEGIALGLVMCDRDRLPYDKVAVDLAFAHAWREWEYAPRFPQVSTDLRNGLDEIGAMTRVDVRKHSLNLYWDKSGTELVILPRAQWSDGTVDAAFAASIIDGDVSADGWKALARAFLERFDGEA